MAETFIRPYETVQYDEWALSQLWTSFNKSIDIGLLAVTLEPHVSTECFVIRETTREGMYPAVFFYKL